MIWLEDLALHDGLKKMNGAIQSSPSLLPQSLEVRKKKVSRSRSESHAKEGRRSRSSSKLKVKSKKSVSLKVSQEEATW